MIANPLGLSMVTWLLYHQVLHQLRDTEILSESCHVSYGKVHLLKNKIVVVWLIKFFFEYGE